MSAGAYTRAADGPGARPWIPVAAWTLVIAVLSCMPASGVAWFEPSGYDRLLHAAFYAVLAALSARAVSAYRVGEDEVAAATLVGTLTFGALMEWAQGFVERRPDVVDLAADAAGILVALTLRAAWRRRPEGSP